MKFALIALLTVYCLTPVSAQKHNAYVDGGISGAYLDPGFSGTYNYNVIKWIGTGIGVQGYVFHPATTNEHQFTPAVYADLRFRIRPEKISQYFVFIDAGMNFYKHNNSSAYHKTDLYTVINDNGTYVGLGLGYFLRLTYRGWGPYATVKLISNSDREIQYNPDTKQQQIVGMSRGTLILSIGFRFGDDNVLWRNQ